VMTNGRMHRPMNRETGGTFSPLLRAHGSRRSCGRCVQERSCRDSTPDAGHEGLRGGTYNATRGMLLRTIVRCTNGRWARDHALKGPSPAPKSLCIRRTRARPMQYGRCPTGQQRCGAITQLGSPRQFVTVDFPGFHHKADVLGRCDVRQRVGGNRYQIGEFPRFDCAKPILEVNDRRI